MTRRSPSNDSSEEMLRRDIETLKKSIRLEDAELAFKILSPVEIAAFRDRIKGLQTFLNRLRERLDGK
jgi:hypothetical protein